MKNPTLLILVSIILLLNFTLPAFADDKDDKYEMVEITQYNIAIVEKGTITVDGVLDESYLGSTKITHYDDEEVTSTLKDDTYIDLTDGRFFAYVVVDTEGMYIYAEIEDKTMYNTASQDGAIDQLIIYLDFYSYADMHPQVGNYVYKHNNAWSDQFSYFEYFGDVRRYRGSVWIDYNDVAKGSYGFHLAQPQMDFCQYKAAKRADETGWIAELFIPWLMDEQGEAIARGEQFHCSIGFHVTDAVTGDSKSYVIRCESPIEIGKSYNVNPSLLSDLIWGERPDPTPETSDTAIAVISALIISGAGVVIFSRKKRS